MDPGLFVAIHALARCFLKKGAIGVACFAFRRSMGAVQREHHRVFEIGHAILTVVAQ